MTKIKEPIEGFFIKTKDDLIFDVKGLSHPADRTIAFVRYIPQKYVKNVKNLTEPYHKIYSLSERYQFLSQFFPKYLFYDPQGRGILQAVPNNDLIHTYNPISRLQDILNNKKITLGLLENQTIELVNQLVDFSEISTKNIGLTGSLLVNLQKKQSDIDLVVYGMKNGRKIYNSMSRIFKKSKKINRYSKRNLRKLWLNRGQEKQIDFTSFYHLEKRKQLQGKIYESDFYIRLVPFPSEYKEPYSETKIKSLGNIQITADIKENKYSMFTPCVYQLENIEIINKETEEEFFPTRIFSLRGRYCELAKNGDRVQVKGKLEKVIIAKQKEFYQLVLGSTQDEFFKKVS